VCCVGSALNYHNSAVFAQADFAIAMQPQLPGCISDRKATLPLLFLTLLLRAHCVLCSCLSYFVGEGANLAL
jgi:hypothetical protein